MAKFDGAGVLLWGTYFGGTGNEGSYKAACDAAGNLLIVGGSTSETGIATPGSYQSTIGLAGTPDAFLAKFSATGALQWATYYGGTGSDDAEYVEYDAAGNIYIAGGTGSPNNIATPGAYQTTPTVGNDAFLAKFSSTGYLLWGTYFGGNDYDYIGGLALNTQGDVFLVGKTMSTDLPTTTASHQSSFTGVETNYISGFDTSGTFKWCTYYGNGTSYTSAEAADAVCDRAGNVYVTGATTCVSNITSADAYFPYSSGVGPQIFMGEFSRTGAFKYGTYYAFFNTGAYAITTDTFSNIIIGGYTDATGGIATPGAHQTTFGGGIYDGVLIRFIGDTSVYFPTAFTDTSLCAGDTLTIPYSVTKAFNAGNIFTAQLFGPTGSFVSPAAIGSAATTIAGSIAASTPVGTPAGTGYRIRIIASSPADTSDNEIRNIRINTLVTPHVSVSSSPTVIIPGSSATFTAATSNGGSAPTYQWYHNGTPIAGAITNPYTVTIINSGDVISVVVHSNASCAIPDTASSQFSVGIKSIQSQQSSFNIYPNPVKNEATLQWDNLTGGRFTITDMEGRLLLLLPLTGIAGSQQISLQLYAYGTYLYKVTDNSGMVETGILFKE